MLDELHAEIKQVKVLFESGKSLCINEFTNMEYPSSDFPLIWKEMDWLIEYPFKAPAKGEKTIGTGLGITPGYIDFQLHDVSIEAHTDDVISGIYFQLVVLSLDDCGGSEYLEKRPTMSYFTPEGKKVTTKLDEGSSLVFNPRKLHSVVYYGYKYLVAIRSVVKCKM